MLRDLKLHVLRRTRQLGVQRAVLKSSWRQSRLCILCYHGISLADEHLWRPGLYLPAQALRRRFEILARNGCRVLPLGEAVRRLYEGTLPRASVALTFDDGNYDFYRQALPLLKEYGYPATVYLTTYYSVFNRPVFDVMTSYILYKSRGKRIDWPEVFGRQTVVDSRTQPLMERIVRARAASGQLTGAQKDELLQELARRVSVDYEEILRQRLLHIMTPDEVRETAAAGIDIQLHTHRHRVSTSQELFDREIRSNRDLIRDMTGKTAAHFCYPAGFTLPEFPEWLKEAGVESATTCHFCLASKESDRFLLPRVLDASHVTEEEFFGWVTGTAAMLPKRDTSADNPLRAHQLMEQPPESVSDLRKMLHGDTQ